MKKISFIILSILVLAMTACQDKDINRQAMVLNAPDASQISGSLNGDNYTWTWGALGSGQQMQVTTYRNGTLAGSEVVNGTSYTQYGVPTNVPFEYVFKVTDGTNLSTGVVKSYLREGATSITGLMMSQYDTESGYNALVEWDKPVDATSIQLTATNGKRTVTEKLSGSAESFIIENVTDGEVWEVTVIASNEKGLSLPTKTSLRIGKTAIGFLSIYETPEELVANGDDDEASAWLWLHENYPTATYLYFGDIKSQEDVDRFRVLFWMRDLEGVGEDAVWAMPDVVLGATPAIKAWYKDGGSLLLWSHAMPYICYLGRMDLDMMKNNDHTIGTGAGGINNDTWKMAVQLSPEGRFIKDHSNHPIYKGLTVEPTGDGRTKLIAFKGPGWTEDHNCLTFNLPSAITGIGNQEEACYTQITETYGIYPLGTWDSQINWVSQLNVWEAQQGNTEFKGTVLCIGNGGCEFSMKNPDGTPDKSAYPKNNIYQSNVLTLAKNSLEYLKTR